MALGKDTFAPQIDYGVATNFVFGDNDFVIVTKPQETRSLVWDTVEVPQSDGGESIGGEESPRVFTINAVLEKTDPAEIHTALEALWTALKGHSSGTTDWPKRHFKFYQHKNGGDVLYLEKCICPAGLRIGRGGDKFYRNERQYTPVEFTIHAMDPDWKTGATSTGSTISGPVIIDVSSGSALVIHNTTDDLDKVVITSGGLIKTVDEIYEQQSSV